MLNDKVTKLFTALHAISSKTLRIRWLSDESILLGLSAASSLALSLTIISYSDLTSIPSFIYYTWTMSCVFTIPISRLFLGVVPKAVPFIENLIYSLYGLSVSSFSKSFSDIPEIKKVTYQELIVLINQLTQFRYLNLEHQIAFDPNNESHIREFLKFLRQACRVNVLNTLVKLGLPKTESGIETFEKVDATSAGIEKLNSLKYLTAQYLTHHDCPNDKKIKVPQEINTILNNQNLKKYTMYSNRRL
ncbi:MAG: hypothetical protein BGO43_07980 [Gammaproteobacteria bacterium 39-13]|nr:hypothetical protein [Gammaproteobacteria bacterium]OJV93107.1 MAG: hypothetical protein BGO43_07980 [Gammaproteobacteria bacterium 39-13]